MFFFDMFLEPLRVTRVDMNEKMHRMWRQKFHRDADMCQNVCSHQTTFLIGLYLTHRSGCLGLYQANLSKSQIICNQRPFSFDFTAQQNCDQENSTWTFCAFISGAPGSDLKFWRVTAACTQTLTSKSGFQSFYSSA